MLCTYIQSDEREWERLLPALELAYNTTSRSSMELSPFEVMIGQHPITAADLDVVGNLAPTLTPPMTKRFQQLCDRARGHILRAKWQQKLQADAHRRDDQYTPGDLVWISSRHLPPLNQCSKFESRFRGPFSIIDRMTSKEAAVCWLPLTDPEGRPTDLYEVHYILAQRGLGPSTQYPVKWLSVPEERATWEPAAHLTNCPALLRAWRRQLRTTQRPHSTVPSAAPPDISPVSPQPSPSPPGREVERPSPGGRSSSNT
ncbi:hypothetical protein EPH_0065680 [Eimeria praecox]|uniref:Chromo domain-containing protein n=1 Tax=Eimeria praecox TaxID=51316 RepID=U6H076_9EIME|nr:hypothetical protein EPH_0065680 [Eimeria praecox]